MASLKLTPAIAQDYVALFLTLQPRDRDAVIGRVMQIAAGQERYQVVANRLTNIPWFVIGLIHSLESDLDWTTHLHNGDPLSKRTTHTPRGRPALGNPPFTWEASACDALIYDGLDEWTDWSVAGILFELEKFNGFGYRSRGLSSPYLWSGSQHYTKGKFVADGKYDAKAVSEQLGAGVLLHALCLGGLVALRATEAHTALAA